jgi:hypothetical protein
MDIKKKSCKTKAVARKQKKAAGTDPGELP